MAMKNIEYYHASVYGNGAQVAEEFRRQMVARGIEVSVHHVDDKGLKTMPNADLYVFSTPGRFGKPIKGMRKFIKNMDLPQGTRFAVLTTEPSPQADKGGNAAPEGGDAGRCQQVMPIMLETLKAKGMIEMVRKKVYVTGLKGPLESGWQEKVRDFAEAIIGSSG